MSKSCREYIKELKQQLIKPHIRDIIDADNDFNYYTIYNEDGEELSNIDGYYMYDCFRKFREQEKGKE